MKKKTAREVAVAASVPAKRRRRVCGATFLEYALLLALVGIVGAIGLKKYGKSLSDFFSAMADKTAEVTPDTTKKK